ncbi:MULTISPECIES: hypothetical protein [Bacillus]|uniref:hypothetical protein n=1 Tax=Bacillus TaxID=1386 RepID=UPI00087310B9|nr:MULTISPECIES: hypothetical protein [Bacillus]MCC0760831.1 hypothetical protein [Bacillus sp. BRTN]MCC0771825.1 hypothetical protein [Bacillus pacificus]MDA1854849.1 hypothetical protein [Bacillus cereus]MDG1569561.1 hypothetical protein [Bacillus cereus]OFE37548.1 hypothetical protein BGV83_06950 [Bacillus anthracis]
MIKFVMVNPIEDIHEKYIENFANELLVNQDIVKTCDIYDTTPFGEKIKLESENGRLYFVETEIYTYNNSKHLFVSIVSQFINQEFDKDLSELKFTIKNGLRKDWEECIWLSDEQSTSFAKELYADIHELENQLRQFINIVMIRNFGVNWWDKYTTRKIQDKYKARFSSYKRVAQSYANVSDRLLSIDTDDLLEIMTLKIKKFSPENNHVVANLLESLKETGDISTVAAEYKKVIEKLRKECEVEIDLWDTLFGKYFPEGFIDEWSDFGKNRNHVAHNKLLDHNAYKTIKKSIKVVATSLSGAETKFNETSFSDEEKEIIQEIEEERKAELEMFELERMESEAGIRILDNESICEIFEENVLGYIDSIRDSIYFRDDVKTEIYPFSYDEGTENELLSIQSKITDDELVITSNLDINEESGGESTLTLKLLNNGEVVDTCNLTYTNGEAALVDEQNYYLPTKYNEFSKGSISEFVVEVESQIEDLFPNLVEIVERAKHESIKNGGNYPVANSECEECSEQYICIDSSICEIGTCVNCGHLNELERCERCEEYYNSNVEGNSSWCQGCLDYIDKQ